MVVIAVVVFVLVQLISAEATQPPQKTSIPTPGDHCSISYGPTNTGTMYRQNARLA